MADTPAEDASKPIETEAAPTQIAASPAGPAAPPAVDLGEYKVWNPPGGSAGTPGERLRRSYNASRITYMSYRSVPSISTG